MRKSDIVAAIIAVVFIAAGGFFAVQPITDPGYVHPVGVILTGVGVAVIGVMMAGFMLTMNAIDRASDRGAAHALDNARLSAEHAARVAAERERESYAPFGW